MNGRWIGVAALALIACAAWPQARGPAPGEPTALLLPADPAAEAVYRFLAGRISEGESQLAEAAAHYERVLVLDPAADEAHRRLVDVYARSGNPERALEHARPVLAQESPGSELRNKAGALFEWIARDRSERHDAAGALRALREKLDLFPGDLAALEGILRLQGEAGLDLIPSLEERARLQPENRLARFELGYAYFHLERYADAARELEPVLAGASGDGALAPLLGRVRLLLGRARGEIGQTASALAVLREIGPGDGLSDEARSEEARLLEAAGRRGEAIRVLRRAIQGREFSDLHIALAELMQRNKQTRQAIAMLRTAVEDEQEPGRARVVLAGVLREAGQTKEAAEVLAAVERGDPAFFEARLGLIQLYESSERLPEAIAELESIAREQPESLQLQVYLASLKRRAGDLAGATQLLETVLRSAGGSAQADRARYALGRFYQEAGDAERALAVLGEIDESSAVRSDARLVLAQLYEERKDFPRAIAELEALIAERPEAVELQIYLAGLHDRSGDLPAALERMEKLVQSGAAKGEEHARALYVLGRLYAQSERDVEAERALRAVPRADEIFADAQLALVQLYEKQERTAEALSAMQGAVELRPEVIDLRVYLAELTQRTGDLPKAIAMMKALIAKNPDRAVDLHYRLGVIYGAAGEEERALQIMEKALVDGGDKDARILNYVGYTWADRGVRLPEAERMIRRAAELEPEDGSIADSLGWVLYRKASQLREGGGSDAQARELFEAALVELERAALLVPNDPVILHHVGDVYRSLERFEQALDTYRSALRVQKDESKAREIQIQIDALEARLRGDRSGYAR